MIPENKILVSEWKVGNHTAELFYDTAEMLTVRITIPT